MNSLTFPINLFLLVSSNYTLFSTETGSIIHTLLLTEFALKILKYYLKKFHSVGSS